MIFFSCLSPQQSFLKRKREREQKGLSTRVQRPQASLFNLMLTAFDVVICHLLIGQHLPRLQKQRKKEKEVKQHLVTCIISLLVCQRGEKTEYPTKYPAVLHFFVSIFLHTEARVHQLGSFIPSSSTFWNVNLKRH